ncbi:hypothetical protein SAMN05720606_10187 [Paenibacillus polysaccharolyticus]|uniref:Uncharacterized protein n=1 Tax=Paenibacillus polysaccharolyticus TaxID=582692 RepID=A0A1G5ASJ4_9BACL|nr:hypothetical protein [Paenibacillus polysaccharolyticus]SCX80857.1 hypothetical protein SAMN05720606_10187 [Paenibacillus polysaccharolyticus]
MQFIRRLIDKGVMEKKMFEGYYYIILSAIVNMFFLVVNAIFNDGSLGFWVCSINLVFTILIHFFKVNRFSTAAYISFVFGVLAFVSVPPVLYALKVEGTYIYNPSNSIFLLLGYVFISTIIILDADRRSVMYYDD